MKHGDASFVAPADADPNAPVPTAPPEPKSRPPRRKAPLRLKPLPRDDCESQDSANPAFGPRPLQASFAGSDCGLVAGGRLKHLFPTDPLAKRVRSCDRQLVFRATRPGDDLCLNWCRQGHGRPHQSLAQPLDSPRAALTLFGRKRAVAKDLYLDVTCRATFNFRRETTESRATADSEMFRKNPLGRSQFRSKSVSTASNTCTAHQVFSGRLPADCDVLELTGVPSLHPPAHGQLHKNSFDIENVLSEDDNKINFGQSFKLSQSVQEDGLLEEDRRHVETIVIRRQEEQGEGEMSGPMMVVAGGFTAVAVTGFIIMKGLRSVFG